MHFKYFDIQYTVCGARIREDAPWHGRQAEMHTQLSLGLPFMISMGQGIKSTFPIDWPKVLLHTVQYKRFLTLAQQDVCHFVSYSATSL
jgi:hypothetical protein